MKQNIQSICVYCGSSNGLDQLYFDQARDLGILLAQHQIRLVYGAGKSGLMGAVADGALSAGGNVLGIVPDNLFELQSTHDGLTKLEIVPNIHLRKARMHEASDAFIALPGGFGTLDELFETITWAQIGIHHKPIGLLNTRDFYTPVMQLIEHLHREQFVYDAHKVNIIKENTPTTLLERILEKNC
jgi:uncharacterized protein (TIGR00730 family)